jgi:hypothetical protein
MGEEFFREDKDIDCFLQFISDALNNVDRKYYSIKIATHTEQSTVFRERVFCYEFYHQMRSLQEKKIFIKEKNNSELPSINIDAEIDKRGHDVIEEDFNPDFVFHKRGKMKNYAVIEVKLRLEDFKKDFQTLCCMINKYDYKCGVFILLNNSYDKFVEKAMEKLKSICFQAAKDKIYVLCKESKESDLLIKKLSDII